MTAIPTASPAAGTYATPQAVTLSAVAGATIVYTTDGSDPEYPEGGIGLDYTYAAGLYWATKNWEGTGGRWPNDSSDSRIREYGKLYTLADALSSGIPAGWRLPTIAELESLAAAAGSGAALKRTATGSWSTGGAPWQPPNTGAANALGIDLLGSGHFNELGSWRSDLSQYAYILASDGSALRVSYMGVTTTIEASGYYCSVRLVRSDNPLNGTTYTTPIAVSESTTIKAIAVLAGVPSAVASFAYVITTYQLFGAPFDGFDRGTTVTIDRNIAVVDTLGGPPRLIERGPSSGALDRWTVSTTFAVPYDKAQAIQAAVPPYGTDTTAEINLPPRSGGSSFPGLGPASSGATFDTYAGVAVRSLESKGQMGVRVDLYGFGIEFDLFCTTTGGGAINSAAAPTVTVPAFVARKFRAHQLNDFSKTQYAVSGGGVLAANSAKIKAGRRKDLNVALDHLTPDEADQLVALFRGVRTGAVTLPFDSDGRPGSGSFLLTGLSFQRQALFWDAKLEVSAA